jgi:hypothetical protein
MLPQRTRDRIERHPEAVADAVGEDLLHVRAGRAADRRAGGEEGIVGRRGAIVVQAKDHAGEVRVVRLRTAELVVGVSGRPTLRQVLHLPTATVVADDDVQLPIRTETDDSAVVITALRLLCVSLERAQLDEIALERQRRSVPHEAIHAIAKQRDVTDHVRIHAADRLGPEEICEWLRRETWMQSDPQKSTFGR